MLGKLIAWGEDREQARLRLLSMLDEFAIGGLKTNQLPAADHRASGVCGGGTGYRVYSALSGRTAACCGPLSDEFWQAAGSGLHAELAGGRWALGGTRGFRAGLPAEITLHLSCKARIGG
jgi:3-methylcrotonyl-CoA carboxylase alpha subunit